MYKLWTWDEDIPQLHGTGYNVKNSSSWIAETFYPTSNIQMGLRQGQV